MSMLKRNLFVTGLIVLTLVATSGQNGALAQFSVSPSRGLINDGAKLLDNGRTLEGMRVTWQALKSKSLTIEDIAIAHNNLCVGYNNILAYDTAIEHCTKAIDLRQRDWRFFNNRGTAWYGLGNYKLALRDFNKALAMGSNSEIITQNIMLARRKQNEAL